MSDLFIDAEHGFVTAEQVRIQEILADYNPNLIILHIPPALQESATDKSHPWCVVCLSPTGEMFIDGLGRADMVMRMKPDEMDHRVLAECFKRDMKNDPASAIIAENAALEILAAKEREEAMAEQRDLALSILKSPKHVYKHDGVKYE